MQKDLIGVSEMNEDRPLQIGVLMGNIQNRHPFEVLRGIYAGAKGKNVNITVFPTALGGIYSYWEAYYDKKPSVHEEVHFATYNYQYNSLYDYALLGDIDVLIVAYGTVAMYLNSSEKQVFFDKFTSIPTIVVQEYDPTKKLNYIIADNYGGIRGIVDHLIEKHNKKRLVFLAGPHMNTDASERLRGYLESMKDHGLEVVDSMIEYGDYSADVADLIEKLLDANPDADGIVCANDEMAITAYQICRARGKEIGKEFSITGFDDIELASRLNPPLTTVKQDGFMLGVKAMELAIQGVVNDANHRYVLESPIKYRASCGCVYEGVDNSINIATLIDGLMQESDESYIQAVAMAIARKCVRDNHTTDDVNACTEFLRETIKIIIKIRSTLLGEDIDQDIIYQYRIILSKLLMGDTYPEIKWEILTGYLRRIVEKEIDASTDNKKNKIRYSLLEIAHQQILAMMVQIDGEKSEEMINRYWSVPRVIQQLKEISRDWNSFFRYAISQCTNEGAHSAYIYLLPQPVKRYEGEDFKCPNSMRLAVEYDGERINVYPENMGVEVNPDNGFTKEYPVTPGHAYVSFLLFSEEEQYGIMICEVDEGSVAGLHGVAMQISSGLSYMHIARREEKVNQELYDTLRELREKNKILNSVSSNDPMTGVYNRRGFMEKVLEINRKHDGEEAYLFFFDMDHLKEINDEFGHSEGDYALIQISKKVNELAGSNGCCGRVGGDEFIAMVPCSESEAKKRLARMEKELEYINRNAKKKYDVECSVGYVTYICSEDVVMEEIIRNADALMYENKKKRREMMNGSNK